MSTEPKPRVNVRFLYAHCNDVKTVRRFYSDALGMREGSFRDDKDWSWLTYKSEGMELMFFRWDKPLPVPTEFACQPGDAGGSLPTASWGIEIPEEDFAAAFGRIRTGGFRTLTPLPTWRQGCYWGITVLDPMGNTVEVYATPKTKPASTTWIAP